MSFKENINRAKEMVVPRLPPARLDAYQTFLRRFSIYASYVLSRLGVTGNQVTVVMALCGIAGGLCFWPRNMWLNVLGIFLWHLETFLDLVDGEVARLQNKTSVVGIYLDYAAHQIATPFIVLGLGMHVYYLDKSSFILVATLLLYSLSLWRRGLASAAKAALFKAGYTNPHRQEKGQNAKSKRWRVRKILMLMGQSLFGIYFTTATGLVLVLSYFAGTTILYVYFIGYTLLAIMVVAAIIMRDIVKLKKIQTESHT